MKKHWKYWGAWLLLACTLPAIIISVVRSDWLALAGWVSAGVFAYLFGLVSRWNDELLDTARNVIDINERLRRGRL